MKQLLYAFILAVFSLSVFTACDNDDDDEAVKPSKAELLTDGTWKGDQVKAPALDAFGITYQDRIPDPKSVSLTFKKDKTYTLTYTQDGTPVSQEGTWELTDNEQKIKADLFGVVSEAEIKLLNAENFNFSTTIEVPVSGVSVPVVVDFMLIK